MAQTRDDQRRAIELRTGERTGRPQPSRGKPARRAAQAAFDLAGTLWMRLKEPHNRVICAWFGALTALAAGIPQARWTEYRTLLAARETALSPTAWGLVEVEQWLARIEEIHQLFLSYFSEAGPAIR
ncbi:MAG: hypothetical protein IPK28_11100 [Devosia sp.]|nr:hypothetical protein [Devosia sp.]